MQETEFLPLQPMLVQTGAFIAAWLLVDRIVDRRGPIPHAHALCRINNGLYSPGSFILLIFILTPSQEPTAQYLYHISKFYEYSDILLVRASGGVVDLHFGVHHLTTPYLTYLRVIRNNEGWRVFAALNAFHHVLMYAFFGGLSLVRGVLPWTGCLQLVVGIAAEVWVGYGKATRGEAAWPNIFAGGLLSVYLVLFTRDLILRTGASNKKEQ